MSKVINMNHRPQSKINWVYIGLIALLIIAWFSSCSTAKELIDKAEKKDPAAVAAYTRDKYPCKDLLKPDTAIIWKDSVIYIECPANTNTNEFEVVRTITDTVNKVIVKTVRVPVNMPVRTQVITKWYEDSAKLKINAVQISRLQTDTAQLRSERDRYYTKAAKRGKENWIWRIIASFFIVLWVWRKYKQLTTIKLRS